jgi:hypothetical protein
MPGSRIKAHSRTFPIRALWASAPYSHNMCRLPPPLTTVTASPATPSLTMALSTLPVRGQSNSATSCRTRFLLPPPTPMHPFQPLLRFSPLVHSANAHLPGILILLVPRFAPSAQLFLVARLAPRHPKLRLLPPKRKAFLLSWGLPGAASLPVTIRLLILSRINVLNFVSATGSRAGIANTATSASSCTLPTFVTWLRLSPSTFVCTSTVLTTSPLPLAKDLPQVIND